MTGNRRIKAVSLMRIIAPLSQAGLISSGEMKRITSSYIEGDDAPLKRILEIDPAESFDPGEFQKLKAEVAHYI